MKRTAAFGRFIKRICGARGKREAGAIEEPVLGVHLARRHEKIREAVEKAAGCEAVYVDTEIVVQMFRDEVIWEGPVEIFSLKGHQTVTRAYGWTNGRGEKTRYTTVLEVPPVTSPDTAVRSAVLWGPKK